MLTHYEEGYANRIFKCLAPWLGGEPDKVGETLPPFHSTDILTISDSEDSFHKGLYCSRKKGRRYLADVCHQLQLISGSSHFEDKRIFMCNIMLVYAV